MRRHGPLAALVCFVASCSALTAPLRRAAAPAGVATRAAHPRGYGASPSAAMFTERRPTSGRRSVALASQRPGGGPGPGPGGPGPGFRLPSAGNIAFFAVLILFPGFFLKIFNGFLIALFVLPPLFIWGFQFWSNRNVISSPCPQCGAPCAAIKAAGETACFTCGADLVLTNDKTAWRMRSKFESPRSAPGGPAVDDKSKTIDVDFSDVD
ncbi:hypothetical protein M885DRAFT_520873 [Pelagophyceae sp. CCMP2097]|nr:hypothetical protein M885DRAFT_520873 [Pelagophyceae sp. CCMP2097]|mmetsp:Transcript_25207/g.86406  ORF Transcript_25207/g.86406 Transcript_25207/m.86406 type:complete len:210 (-) Transcript_25207:54-683(-)